MSIWRALLHDIIKSTIQPYSRRHWMLLWPTKTSSKMLFQLKRSWGRGTCLGAMGCLASSSERKCCWSLSEPDHWLEGKCLWPWLSIFAFLIADNISLVKIIELDPQQMWFSQTAITKAMSFCTGWLNNQPYGVVGTVQDVAKHYTSRLVNLFLSIFFRIIKLNGLAGGFVKKLI